MTVDTLDPTSAIAMELDHIAVRGFRSLRDVHLEFGRRSVLIGANGSGKSNLVSVFDLLGALRSARLRHYSTKAGGAEALLWFGSKRTDAIDLEVSFNGGENGYRVELVPDSSDQLVPVSETCWFWDKTKHPDRPYEIALIGDGVEAGISDPPGEKIVGYVQSWLDDIRSYHFHDTSGSSPMRKLADIHDTHGLRSDGANLAPYLRFLSQSHPESYSFIRKNVQRVAPFFDDFVLKPPPGNKKKLLLEWRHVSSDHYFNASSLSDGTLRFMALATLLLQPQKLRPSVIVLDEPELGLHPYAITMLASMAKSTSAETQVVLATQSSLLLDHFEPSDIVVAEAIDEETKVRRLESQSLETWLEEYSLGQLWEKNQLGGRPGAHR